MARILFTLIIHPSYEKALKHGFVKSTLFRKSSLNLSFGQVAISYQTLLSQTQSKPYCSKYP